MLWRACEGIPCSQLFNAEVSAGVLCTGTPDQDHHLIRRESLVPDSKPDMIRAVSGLDESALESSEPTILRRILRSTMKGTAALEVDEKPHEGIKHDDSKRDAKIDAWIASVEQLREVESAGEVCAECTDPEHECPM